MGNTRETGHLQNLITYDSSGNITLPANLTLGGVLVGYTTTAGLTTLLSGYSLSTHNHNGTYVPVGRTITINGVVYDLSADRAWTITTSDATKLPLAGGTLTGDLTLSGTNPKLYFTDTDNNPDYFVSNTDGTFTVYDVTNSVGRFKIYTTGNAEFSNQLTALSFVKTGGTSAQFLKADGTVDGSTYLTGITSGNVTTALGFTPYNATNPNGYITGITSGNVTAALGYTPVQPNGTGASGSWGINITGYAMSLNGYANQTEYTILNGPANGPVIKVRYDSATANRYIDFGSKDGNGVYYEGLKIYNGSTPTWGGNTILHAGNYNSYSPSLTGGNASGTWGINVTGSAATLGGYGPNQTGGANTIVQRDGNGYIQNSYFYTSGGGSERGTGISYIAGFNSSDYYIRSYTLQGLASAMSGASMNINGNAASATYAPNLSLNGGQSGGITLNEGRTGVYRTESGSGGTMSYAPLLHVGGGDTMWQIQGSYGGGTTLQWRSGYAGTWYSWWSILHSGNYNSYSPTLTGGGASGTWSINVTGSSSALTNNATISGLNFGGVLALTGSGASTGNSTGARLSESYGPLWDCSNGATWHHQIINGSSLVGITAGGTNYGSGRIYASGNITSTGGNVRSNNWLYSEGNSGWYNDTYGQGLRQVKGNVTYGNVIVYGENYNGWSGYNTNLSTITAFMQNSSGTHGFYQENNAGWTLFWNAGYACWGLGTDATDPSYSLHITKYGGSNTGWIIWSDRRIKENIKTIDNALDKVLALRGVYYNKIDDVNKERQVGYIAQEVMEVVPELVVYSEELDIYNMNYAPMVAMLTEAMKEQQTQIEQLKQQVQTLLNS